MALGIFAKNKQNIIYGVSLALLLLLLKWLEWRFVIIDNAFEFYAGSIAIVFTALGIWLALKLIKPKVKTIVIEKPVVADARFKLNDAELSKFRISGREL